MLRRPPGWLLAAAAYLILAVVLWAHAWAHPTTVLPAGSVDPAQEAWDLGWGAWSLAHLHNPFYTSLLDVPRGVNMASNTSMLLLGWVLAPVTWLGGPILSEVVAVTLAPALSALAAYAACRRFTVRRSAAFAGGLLYGFSPDLLDELRFAHLDLTFLALVPLMIIAGDAIVRRGRPDPGARAERRDVLLGVGLGVLCAAEFLVSAEVLAMSAVLAVVALAAAVISRFARLGRLAPAAVSRAGGTGPGALVGRRPLTAFGVAALTALCMLAWPAYEFAFGPQHYSGALYATNVPELSSTLGGVVLPWQRTASVQYVAGGNTAYLGAILIVVLVVGLARHPAVQALRWAAGMAAASFVLSLGDRLHIGAASTAVPMPSWLVQRVPLFQDVLPYRFAGFTALFAGIALEILVDLELTAGSVPGQVPAGRIDLRHRRLSSLGLPAAVLALVPLAIEAPAPYAVASAPAPAALGSAAIRSLPAGAVLIEYPLPADFNAAPMLWQAESDMPYRLVGGYQLVPGFGGAPTNIIPTDEIGKVMLAAELGRLPPSPLAIDTYFIRYELSGLRPGAILVLAGHTGTARVLTYLTAAIGRPPQRVPGGWFWRGGMG